MRRIMAVYDVDPFYADRFAEFVNRRETVPFTAVAFTSLARLREYAASQPVELLLVGDEVDEAELAGIPVDQTVRLSETGTEKDGMPTVYKYQSSDNVLREVMACYQVNEQPVLRPVTGTRSRVIGIYSPVGRCGKTGFAFTLGQVLARQGKALLLSMEVYSGLGKLTAARYDKSLADLVYYNRQGEYSRLRLSGVTYNWGGLDYVPPVTYAEDMADMEGGELGELVEKIAAEGIYEVILLDMGAFARGAEQLLSLCQVIYAPVKEDAVSSAKVEEWKRYLEVSGRMQLWERIRILRLPPPQSLARQEDYLEQLLWGPVGDFARELVNGKEGNRR